MTTAALTVVPQNEPRDLIRWTPDQIGLIQRTVAKGTSADEFKLFLYQAARTGLDPLAKQIYAIKRWNAKEQREVMAIQTGIDGFRVVADRTGKYAGSEDAVFSAPAKSGMSHGEAEKLDLTATVTVWKIVSGVRCPFTATAHWQEYYPGEKSGAMWRNKPHVMLSKCAESLALRKAFPADLSGVYTKEEMEQAGEVIDAPRESVSGVIPVLPDPEPALAPVREEVAVPEIPNDTTAVITLAQRRRLFGIAKSLGFDEARLREEVRRVTGQESTSDLRQQQYDRLIGNLERAAGVPAEGK